MRIDQQRAYGCENSLHGKTDEELQYERHRHVLRFESQLQIPRHFNQARPSDLNSLTRTGLTTRIQRCRGSKATERKPGCRDEPFRWERRLGHGLLRGPVETEAWSPSAGILYPVLCLTLVSSYKPTHAWTDTNEGLSWVRLILGIIRT